MSTSAIPVSAAERSEVVGVVERPIALVTGASRGIGRAIAIALAAEGYEVIGSWLRDRAAAESLEEEITSQGGACRTLRANAGSRKGVDAMLEACRERGRLDALIHNAALGSFKPTLEVRENQWAMTMNINVWALLELSRGLSDLLARSGGCVVSLTSVGGARVIPNYGVVGVSKAALESMTRYLAFELGPSHVRVNAIRAGWVETDAVRALPGSETIRETVRQRVALGRLASPADIANAVKMLIRPEAAWITGQVIVADGGEGLM